MIKVYIASPYSIGDKLENVEVQLNMADLLMDNGFAPFVPLYSHYQNEYKSRSYEWWMKIDFEWLEMCDCVLRLPGESSGADREVKYAKELGIPVFYDYTDLIKSFKI